MYFHIISILCLFVRASVPHTLCFVGVLFHAEHHASWAEPSKQMRFSLRPGIWAIVCKQYKYDVIFDGFFFSARVGARANTIVTTFFYPVFFIINSHICLFSSCFLLLSLCYYRCWRCYCHLHQYNCFSLPQKVSANVFYFHFLCGWISRSLFDTRTLTFRIHFGLVLS